MGNKKKLVPILRRNGKDGGKPERDKATGKTIHNDSPSKSVSFAKNTKDDQSCNKNTQRTNHCENGNSQQSTDSQKDEAGTHMMFPSSDPSDSGSDEDFHVSSEALGEEESEEISVEWSSVKKLQRDELMKNLVAAGATIKKSATSSNPRNEDQVEDDDENPLVGEQNDTNVGVMSTSADPSKLEKASRKVGENTPTQLGKDNKTGRGQKNNCFLLALSANQTQKNPAVNDLGLGSKKRQKTDILDEIFDPIANQKTNEVYEDRRDFAFYAQESEIDRKGIKASEQKLAFQTNKNPENTGKKMAQMEQITNNSKNSISHIDKQGEGGKNTYKDILMKEQNREAHWNGQNSMFKKNRNWNRGMKLELLEENAEEENAILIEEDELEKVEEIWGVCLVGYIAGDNIGKGAIIACCNSWNVKHKLTFDESGWLLINLESEEDRTKVLENGPYVIFKKPLILKPMPALFSFNDDEISKVPLWVRLPGLPLELWTENTLSRIGSKLGTPISTDELTCSKERKGFARIFVEVDVAKNLKREVLLKFSGGKEIKQRVIYEFIPNFCNKCKAIGHSIDMCKEAGRYKAYQFRKHEQHEETWFARKNQGQQETNINRGKVTSKNFGPVGRKLTYREKGKGILNEDPSKNFEYTKYEAGAGKPSLKNVDPTCPRKGVALVSCVVGDHSDKETQTSKYMGDNANSLVEIGESNQRCSKPVSNQVDLGKGNRPSRDHEVGNGPKETNCSYLGIEDSRGSLQHLLQWKQLIENPEGFKKNEDIWKALEFVGTELKRNHKDTDRGQAGNPTEHHDEQMAQGKQWGNKKGNNSEYMRNENICKALEFVGMEISKGNRNIESSNRGNQHTARTQEEEWSVQKTKKRRPNKTKGAPPPTLTMIFASWNIRGFNKALKQHGVKSLITENNIDILGLLETKSTTVKIEKFLRIYLPNWCWCNNFEDSEGGRIAVLWNPEKVDVICEETHSQGVHCFVRCRIANSLCFCTFVYGHNNLVIRRNLWDFLRGLDTNVDKPWLILGDFNSIMNTNERRHGAGINFYEMGDMTSCCTELGLTDLPMTGCFYTWSNNKIESKIDRALVNNIWMDSDLKGSALFNPPGILSDHASCVVKIGWEVSVGKKPFRYFNMWSEHDTFKSIVSEAWQRRTPGSFQFRLATKLKSIKSNLKELNINHFSHISERRKCKEEELLKAQENFLSLQENDDLQDIPRLQEELSKISKAERSFLSQKAKSKFFANSDKGTRFFHSLVKRNARRNFIPNLIREDGTRTSSENQVVQELVGFYEGLLGTEVSNQGIDSSVLELGEKINEADNQELTRNLTFEEVKNAMFSMGNEKSPGPDGFSAQFFKSSWDIVGYSVFEATREFFQNTNILKQTNHAIIALIPKTNTNPKASDFRPISLCNVSYKIITKILVERMKAVMDKLIDDGQGAFLHERRMSDNIFLMQELMRGYNRKRSSPRCTFKVDLCKAYDTISWNFVQEVLTGLGFSEKFVGWVIECISSTSYSVQINGRIHGHFKGRRGLRQGDPLSPYVFILCLEYLSRSIKRDTENSNFNYHPGCEKLKITHLAFADDLMLLARGDQMSIEILMKCLNDFGAKSGLIMNKLKSCFYTAGVQEQCLQSISDASQLLKGTMPFRYLGIPLAAQNLKTTNYSPLTEKIAGVIGSWKGETLTYAGRAELIKSVIGGIMSFWFGIFSIPATVNARIIKLCRDFFWGEKNALVAWEKMCKPKEEGGLGFRDLKAWNDTLQAKILWNLSAKKDSLWIKWINQIYLKDQSVWCWSVKTRDSAMMKNMHRIKSMLLNKFHYQTVAEQHMKGWFEEDKMKEAYEFFRTDGQRVNWSRVVWCPQIIPKQSYILWLAVCRRLRTKDRINTEVENPECPLCRVETETINHLFFQCRISKAVWKKVKEAFGIKKLMSSLDSATKWLGKENHKKSSKSVAKKLALAGVVYHLWNARNRSNFENENPDVKKIVKTISMQIYMSLYTHFPNLLPTVRTNAGDDRGLVLEVGDQRRDH